MHYKNCYYETQQTHCSRNLSLLHRATVGAEKSARSLSPMTHGIDTADRQEGTCKGMEAHRIWVAGDEAGQEQDHKRLTISHKEVQFILYAMQSPWRKISNWENA